MPPVERPSAGLPAYVANCAACVQILSLLNELCAATYNAPGRAGERMHRAHEVYGLDRVLETVRRQHRKIGSRPFGKRAMSPDRLFEPASFDTSVNDTGPRTTTLADLLGEAT